MTLREELETIMHRLDEIAGALEDRAEETEAELEHVMFQSTEEWLEERLTAETELADAAREAHTCLELAL